MLWWFYVFRRLYVSVEALAGPNLAARLAGVCVGRRGRESTAARVNRLGANVHFAGYRWLFAKSILISRVLKVSQLQCIPHLL